MPEYVKYYIFAGHPTPFKWHAMIKKREGDMIR
jgi:hypothetical protein